MNKTLIAKYVSSRIKLRHSFILALAITSPIALAADELTDQNTNTEDNTLDTLVISGVKQSLTTNISQSSMRTEANLAEIPRSVVVINDEIASEQNAGSLSDVVHNISNVSEDNNYGGTRDQFSIRGFNANVYEDGARVYGVAQDKAVMEDIQYVEVIKGPESVLYGNMNPGGLINIISKKPSSNQATDIELNLDEHGQQRLSIDSTGALNKDKTVLYRIVGVTDDSDGWRDDSDSTQTFIAPTITWFASEDTEVTLFYKYNKEDLPFDRGTLAVRNSSNTGWDFLDINDSRIGTSFSRQERETKKFGFEVAHDVNDYWTTRLKYQHQKRDTDGRRVHFYAASDASASTVYGTSVRNQDQYKVAFDGNINRYVNDSQATSNTDIFSWENQLEFDWGKSSHTIITGADATRYKETIINNASKSWSNTSMAALSALIFGETSPNSGLYNYYTDSSAASDPNDYYHLNTTKEEIKEYGIFINDLIKYGDWNFALGLRHDTYSRKFQDTYDSTILAHPAGKANFSNSDAKSPNDSNLSGQAGALYKLSDSVSLFSNIATSYLPNNNFDAVKQEWVDAQKGTQIEVGSRFSFLNHKLNLTASAFHINLDNVAYKKDSTTNSYDVYKQRSQGFEIDGDYAINDQLTTLFSYGYTDVEFVDSPDSANKPVNVPLHNASAWLFYDVTEEWGVGTGIVYVGERAGNRRKDYDYKLDAYTTTDVTLWYQPSFANDQLRMQLTVANIFDEDYYSAGSDSTQNAVYLGEPRTVSLKAKYSF